MLNAGLRGKVIRLAVVIGGLVLGQFALYGPSLLGKKILLPLDFLAQKSIYLPQTSDVAKIQPQSPCVMEMVVLFEPARRFAVSELQAGRLPMWDPYEYAGAPFVWPKFSPFLALECLTASPVIVAWGQMVAAIVAGLGAYLFFRRAAAVSFWPAAIAAWCYPMTAFFIYWLGFPTSLSVYWLPWTLLAVHNLIESRRPVHIASLAVVTGLVLVSGHPDLAAQTLIISGAYALRRLWRNYRNQLLGWAAQKMALRLVVGWGLGFMLAAPHLLPLFDYAHTGARMLERSRGAEERPPTGLAALPEIVLPDFYGTNIPGKSLRYFDVNQFESAGAAYTGLLATAILAPLAWRKKEQREFNWFWAWICMFGLAWCLNVPGVVQIMRLPGLNMLSHNRWVFASSFAILILAAGGLEAVRTGPIFLRRWDWIVPGLLGALAAWCLYRFWFLPEPIASQMERIVRTGHQSFWAENLNDVHAVQGWFARHYFEAAAACAVGIGAWLWLKYAKGSWQPRTFPLLGILTVAELLLFAHGRNPQCDPSLYYPALPALQEIDKCGPGRLIGHDCLPPGLASVWHLSDVRGYDSIDPGRFVELVRLTRTADVPETSYALTQWLIPRLTMNSDGSVRLPPILDMLGVRYIVTRVAPPARVKVAFHNLDYWVLTNSRALPRAFVPRQVETVEDDQDRLLKLASPDFDPSAVAFVETPVDLPAGCRGSAEITSEIPTRVTISVRMETPGLVVLTDLWNDGWHAYRNGQRVPILRTNHAVRGVVMPTGNAIVEFRYEPTAFRVGLLLAGFSAATIVLLLIIEATCARSKANTSSNT